MQAPSHNYELLIEDETTKLGEITTKPNTEQGDIVSTHRKEREIRIENDGLLR